MVWKTDRIYAAISGAIFGGAFAFFIIKSLFILSMVASIIAGIYISEKWCSNYLSKKEITKQH